MLSLSVIQLLLLSALLIPVVRAQTLSCPVVSTSAGKDFHGQRIVKGNFAYQDLSNANFSGATLVAPYFAFANLTNANFQEAVFVGEGGDPTPVSDFSFATLTKSCFISARFENLTYFTGATLTCADFSKTDLSSRNAVFGGTDVIFDRSRTDCRVAFRLAKMDCELLSEWRYFNLSGADIGACADTLTGHDFTGAVFDGVNFSGINLSGAKFVGANLNNANLNQATLVESDFSKASLLGAQINHANLTHANFYHAFLSNDSTSGFTNSASISHSHLRNVNLSDARLNGVDFTFSNFYGENPTGTGGCKTAASASQCNNSGQSSYDGFTCGCATAHGAVMAGTEFKGAYVYGVDFTGAKLEGADFHQAVLPATNFNGAVIKTGASGNVTTFNRAFLQGANFGGVQFETQTTFIDAFVDFRQDGNNLYILLDGDNHNQFACANCIPPKGSDVCVIVNYPGPSLFPQAGVQFACPSPGAYGTCGAQSPDGSNPQWESSIKNLATPPNGVPPAWYESDSTYMKAPANPGSICNGKDPTFLW